MKVNRLYFFNKYSYYVLSVFLLAIISTTLFVGLSYLAINFLSQINILKSTDFFNNDSSLIILFSVLAGVIIIILLLTLLVWNRLALKTIKIKLYAKMIKVEVDDKTIDIDKEEIVDVNYKKSKNDKRSKLLIKTKKQTYIFLTPTFGKADVNYLKEIAEKINFK